MAIRFSCGSTWRKGILWANTGKCCGFAQSSANLLAFPAGTRIAAPVCALVRNDKFGRYARIRARVQCTTFPPGHSGAGGRNGVDFARARRKTAGVGRGFWAAVWGSGHLTFAFQFFYKAQQMVSEKSVSFDEKGLQFSAKRGIIQANTPPVGICPWLTDRAGGRLPEKWTKNQRACWRNSRQVPACLPGSFWAATG